MSLKLLVNNPAVYEALQEYVDEQIKKEHQILEFQTDSIVIYKAQGALATLRKLKKLRETANSGK